MRTTIHGRDSRERHGEDAAALPLRLAVLCLGFSAIVVQMVVLREMLGVFAGHELTLGIVLAAWLLLMGCGGMLGRRVARQAGREPTRGILLGLTAIAILPLGEVAGIRLVTRLLPAGLPASAGGVLGVSLLVLLPFCLLAGFLLARLTGMASRRRGAEQVGDVYVLDAAGSVAGGLFFSFGFLHFLPPFGTLTALLALNLLAAMLLAHRTGRKLALAGLTGILVASLGAIRLVDPEVATARATFPGDGIVFRRATAYGVLAATRHGGQVDVYENGVPIASTRDPAAAEDTVHPALAQVADAERVLLIGGALTGAVDEVAKHPIARIDVVELDPAVLDLAARLAPRREDARVHSIAGDARRLVRESRGVYDAILLALPDPSTAQINRYYTAEFFEEARRALRPDGVLSLRLTAAENYADPELRLLASSIHLALSSTFPHTFLIPGARQVWLASARPLGTDIAERLERRGIETKTMHAGYLAARLTPDRIAAAREAVSEPVAANRDLRPASYHALLQRWLRRMGSGLLLPCILAASIVMVLAARLAGSPRRAVPLAIGSSGFAGMALEIMLLLAFQARYGSVYRGVGLLLTAFLAGAAAGAWHANRGGGGGAERTAHPRCAGGRKASPAARVPARGKDPAQCVLRLDETLAALALLLAPGIEGILRLEGSGIAGAVTAASFPLLNGAVGFLVGAQFPPAARLLWDGAERTAGGLYALDLLGASLGALAVSALAIPLLGIPATCLAVGGLKVLSVAALRLEAWRGDPAAAWGLGSRPATAIRAASRVYEGRKVAAAGICILILAALGAAIASRATRGWIYDWSFAPVWVWSTVGVLGAGIWFAIDPPLPALRSTRLLRFARRTGRAIHTHTTLRPFTWISYATLSLAVFYPVFRCYFRVPYLFCHVCPRRCIFGFVRPFLIPSALLMNLEKRFWCTRACPIGTVQDCAARTRRGVRRPPRLFLPVSLGTLAFTAVTYFLIRRALQGVPLPGWDTYTSFFRNTFAVHGTVLVVAAMLLAAAFVFRRPFCEMLCPVGRFSELVLGLERRGARKRTGTPAAPAGGERRRGGVHTARGRHAAGAPRRAAGAQPRGGLAAGRFSR